MSPLRERIRDRLWMVRIDRQAKPRKGRRHMRMAAKLTFKSAGSLRAYLNKPRPGARRR